MGGIYILEDVPVLSLKAPPPEGQLSVPAPSGVHDPGQRVPGIPGLGGGVILSAQAG